MGRTAGRLFAISTAGSIAGTFATAFWLIPELGTDQVLAAAAVALMLAAAGIALVERLAVAGVVALVLAGASIGAVVSLAPESGATVSASQLRNWSPVYRQQSAAGPGPARSRSRSPATRSCTPPTRSTTGSPWSRTRRAAISASTARSRAACTSTTRIRTRFAYSDYLQLPFAYRAQTENVLYIGLGGGSAPKRTWRDFPGVQLDAVELDPEVVDVAYEYFELPRDPRMKVEVQDGRRYVADERRALGRDRRSMPSTPTRSRSTSRRGSSSSSRGRG